jgi:galactokinase
MNALYNLVCEAFAARFGEPPTHVVRAPGRVNLIGEHTDYNDGFVMPLAIDRATWIALRPCVDDTVQLYSLDHQEEVIFRARAVERAPMSWREYPKGVAKVLHEAGYRLRGWEGVTCCDVPMGAGLSSSASFELAVARAFASVSGFAWDAPRMALLGQKAENEWVGVKCGIMDQMISAVGLAGQAVLIDCRDLSLTYAPLPAGAAVVIMDTMTRRGLVDSAYNERRSQCQQAAAHFNVKALRDISWETLIERQGELDALTARRARHVIGENARTEEAAAAMQRGDAMRLGQLMNESGESLRCDFEVTNRELDLMVNIARAQPGCLGARMTGAGFGGCAVALVKDAEASRFVGEVTASYLLAAGRKPALYVTPACAGASEVAR